MENKRIFMESISTLGMDKDLVDAVVALHETIYAGDPRQENTSIRSKFVNAMEKSGIERAMCEAIADVYAHVYGNDLINGTNSSHRGGNK